MHSKVLFYSNSWFHVLQSSKLMKWPYSSAIGSGRHTTICSSDIAYSNVKLHARWFVADSMTRQTFKRERINSVQRWPLGEFSGANLPRAPFCVARHHNLPWFSIESQHRSMEALGYFYRGCKICPIYVQSLDTSKMAASFSLLWVFWQIGFLPR